MAEATVADWRAGYWGAAAMGPKSLATRRARCKPAPIATAPWGNQAGAAAGGKHAGPGAGRRLREFLEDLIVPRQRHFASNLIHKRFKVIARDKTAR